MSGGRSSYERNLEGCFASTGDASSVDEYLWLMGRAHYEAVIEYCGGTKIGGAFASGSLLRPQALAAFSAPAMGFSLFILDLIVMDTHFHTICRELALDPTMLGASTTLLNANHYDVYFKGMPSLNGKILGRRHVDEFERISFGCYRAHGYAGWFC